MPYISSPNPDFQRSNNNESRYSHPAEARSPRPIPMAFQITSPVNRRKVLLPHSLVMHVNPLSINETHTQKIERFQTRGGWVEQHWGHDLVEISADASTGAFMNVYTGLASVMRQRTIAWDRFRDLLDLYHNNGSLHDPFGNIVLQGYVQLMYDRGTYLGSFRSFEFTETADSPFAFQLSWTFKVERTILKVPPFDLRGFDRSNAFGRVEQRPNPTKLNEDLKETQRLIAESEESKSQLESRLAAQNEALRSQAEAVAVAQAADAKEHEERLAEKRAREAKEDEKYLIQQRLINERADPEVYGIDINQLFPGRGTT